MSLREAFKNYSKNQSDEHIKAFNSALNDFLEEKKTKAQEDFQAKQILVSKADTALQLPPEKLFALQLFFLTDEIGDMLPTSKQLQNLTQKTEDVRINRLMPLINKENSISEAANWIYLSDILMLGPHLKPIITAHQNFKKTLGEFEAHVNTLSYDEQDKKQAGSKFAASTSEKVDSFLTDIYSTIIQSKDEPEEILKTLGTFRSRANELDENLKKDSSEFIEQFQVHPRERINRIIGDVCLGVSAIFTAGLTIVGKLVYTKVTTGQARVFDSIASSSKNPNTVLDRVTELKETLSQNGKS